MSVKEYIEYKKRTKGEPTNREIMWFAEKTGLTQYGAREKIREAIHGGPAPDGYDAWGDYWKSY